MENITSITELKRAIQLLEIEQANKGQMLKDQFYVTYESLKPINLLKSTLKDVSSSPYLIDNILSNVAGMASGYLSKKIVVGGSGNVFRKLLGSLLQVGVRNVVAQHPEAIKSFGQYIFQKLRDKKMNSQKNG
jgi:hypothetical protein